MKRKTKWEGARLRYSEKILIEKTSSKSHWPSISIQWWLSAMRNVIISSNLLKGTLHQQSLVMLIYYQTWLYIISSRISLRSQRITLTYQSSLSSTRMSNTVSLLIWILSYSKMKRQVRPVKESKTDYLAYCPRLTINLKLLTWNKSLKISQAVWVSTVKDFLQSWQPKTRLRLDSNRLIRLSWM